MKPSDVIITGQPCPYCGKAAELVDGSYVYPHRYDLAHKQFWVCTPCDARVGCHSNSIQPLGRLANAELRGWKMQAHAAFDPIWKRKYMRSRGVAYSWLANQLELKKKDCHIGMFGVDMCKRVVEVCSGFTNSN